MSITAVDITPNADQQEALDKIEMWLGDRHKQTFSLGGLAGTGKSTIIPLVINICERLGIVVKIATPTGKASSVVNKKLATWGMPEMSQTIHSLMYTPVTSKKANRTDHLGRELEEPVFEENAFGANLVIIDEASMVDDKVYQRMIKEPCSYLFIGDHGQLPPVQSDEISRTLRHRDHTLTKIVRQGEDSPILKMAYDVRFGGSLHTVTPGIDQRVIQSWTSIADFAVSSDAGMVIAATNKARHNLNNAMRQRLGFTGHPLSEGERCLILSNSHPHGVFNGELYTVGKVHRFRQPRAGEDGPTLEVDLLDDDGEVAAYGIELGYDWRVKEALDEGIVSACPGYCLTCHKAQGSEADRAIIYAENVSWMNEHAPAWRYTAVTRAKHDLSIVSPW